MLKCYKGFVAEEKRLKGILALQLVKGVGSFTPFGNRSLHEGAQNLLEPLSGFWVHPSSCPFRISKMYSKRNLA